MTDLTQKQLAYIKREVAFMDQRSAHMTMPIIEIKQLLAAVEERDRFRALTAIGPPPAPDEERNRLRTALHQAVELGLEIAQLLPSSEFAQTIAAKLRSLTSLPSPSSLHEEPERPSCGRCGERLNSKGYPSDKYNLVCGLCHDDLINGKA